MSPPASFTRENAAAFQSRIDGVTGTRDGRPIVKLAWAPDELRWYPHKVGTEPPGYVFPIFYSHRDENKQLVAAPRWVLLQRAEPQHYAATWERGRYGVVGKDVWDQRGPCPPERYTELRVHSHHDGECCPCHGDQCECVDEKADHCWGKYLDPNEHLLNWIRQTARESEADSDVQPNKDVRYLETPNAQREVVNRFNHTQAHQDKEIDEFSRDAVEHFLRQPVTTIGSERRTKSGIILLN